MTVTVQVPQVQAGLLAASGMDYSQLTKGFMQAQQAANQTQLTQSQIANANAQRPGMLANSVQAQQQLLANTAYGITKLDPADQPAAYSSQAQNLISQGVVRPQDVPAWDQGGQQLVQSFAPRSPLYAQELQREVALAGLTNQIKGTNNTGANALQTEFDKNSTDYKAALTGYRNVQAAAQNPSNPYNDKALVFAAIQTFSPGAKISSRNSKLLEGAENTPQQLQEAWEHVSTGNTLTPQMRQNLVGAVNDRYKQAETQQNTNETNFANISKARGLDPSSVLIDYSGKSSANKQLSLAQRTPDAAVFTMPNGHQASYNDILQTAKETGQDPAEVMVNLRLNGIGVQGNSPMNPSNNTMGPQMGGMVPTNSGNL